MEKASKDSVELAKVLEFKKAKNLLVLDVSALTPIADFFVIVSSESFVHSKALEDYAVEFLEKLGYKRVNSANIFAENPWILLDYGSIIVHIFKEDARGYYELEKLWHSAKKVYQALEK